jgi:hypothetical protein
VRLKENTTPRRYYLPLGKFFCRHNHSISCIKMPLVSYSCSASAPASLAFQLLAKIQDTHVDFIETSDETPSLKVVTANPILGSSSTSTSVSWVGCARTLSQLVPSLGLWDGPTVESWVESAATAVIPCISGTSLSWSSHTICHYCKHAHANSLLILQTNLARRRSKNS